MSEHKPIRVGDLKQRPDFRLGVAFAAHMLRHFATQAPRLESRQCCQEAIYACSEAGAIELEGYVGKSITQCTMGGCG